MNKDVEKIRAEVERRYNYHKDHADDWAGTCNFWSAHEDREILSFIDSMQEEPVYTDFTKALAECISQAQVRVVDPLVLAETWKDELIKLAKSEEPVSDDLESEIQRYNNSLNLDAEENYEWDDIASNVILAARHFAKWQKAKDESTTEDLGEYINELSKQFPEVSFAKLSRIAVRVAKWQKSNLWKPADGDDLPEIDREVIALLNDGKVVFAHRPYKGKYIGKNLTTGNIETFENETYDKGGWNIPNVKYWLDVELPKEI